MGLPPYANGLRAPQLDRNRFMGLPPHVPVLRASRQPRTFICPAPEPYQAPHIRLHEPFAAEAPPPELYQAPYLRLQDPFAGLREAPRPDLLEQIRTAERNRLEAQARVRHWQQEYNWVNTLWLDSQRNLVHQAEEQLRWLGDQVRYNEVQVQHMQRLERELDHERRVRRHREDTAFVELWVARRGRQDAERVNVLNGRVRELEEQVAVLELREDALKEESRLERAERDRFVFRALDAARELDERLEDLKEQTET